MQSLKFKRLLVMSSSERSANRFDFSPTLNLITADDNNLGKSTVVKLLFWTFGCEPFFDTKWTNRDAQSLVDFEIGEKQFQIYRYKDIIKLKDLSSRTFETYNKVTGPFSKRMAEILSFHALLPARNKKLEIPPPAFYFVPFYIDQKRNWITAWDAFENLAQYQNWKPQIIKYHIGLLTKRYFEIEKEKFEWIGQSLVVDEEIKRLSATLSVVTDYLPELPEALTVDKARFELMTDEIRTDLTNLVKNQEQLLQKLSEARSERSFLDHQRAILSRIVNELELDYRFSVENIPADEVNCPLCGTTHENSVFSRASLLRDKQEAVDQKESLDASIRKVDEKIELLDSRIARIQATIENLQVKYQMEENIDTLNFDNIIENIAGRSIQSKVTLKHNQRLGERKEIKKQLRKLSKERKQLLKTQEEVVNADFQSVLQTYAAILNATDVNFSQINSPMDFTKIIEEGGAAENSRAVLAYYATIFTLINRYGSDVKAPFVIDTPNQQEQSKANYDRIIELITTQFTGSQVILCAMKNQQLEPFRKVANVISLNVLKVLLQEKFETVSEHFAQFESDQP